MTSSTSSDVLLVIGMALGVAGCLSSIFVKSVRLERRVYWVSWFLTSTLISLSLLDRGWRSAAIGAAACAGAAFSYAYLRTTYVKIGGRVYTYTLFRNRPDSVVDGSPTALPDPPADAYGNVLTAPKFWWTVTAFAVAAAILAVTQGPTAVTIGGGVLVIMVMAFAGYIDAHEGFPAGRRQHIQLALITVASVPLFLLPLLAYAVAHLAARR